MRLALVSSTLLTLLLCVSAASCSPRACSPQSCATGCCTDTGECAGGSENASCGSAGNACVNCAASAQVCGSGVCRPLSLGTGGGSGMDAGSTMDAGSSIDAGSGMDAGGPFSCTRTVIECSDQVIQQLDLKTNVTTGLITTQADGIGFRSTIDAVGGGFPPTDSYVYARFTDTSLEKLPISDMTALDSMDWDIAFRRYVIRINSGDSGPSCVGAQLQPNGSVYESITAVPAGFLPEADDFFTRPPACDFIDDGSGLGSSPRTYLSSFYAYRGCVSMTGAVYVLRTQYGRHVKLTVTGYYATEAAQTNCQTNMTSGGSPGGTIRVRWHYLD